MSAETGTAAPSRVRLNSAEHEQLRHAFEAPTDIYSTPTLICRAVEQIIAARLEQNQES